VVVIDKQSAIDKFKERLRAKELRESYSVRNTDDAEEVPPSLVSKRRKLD